MDGWPRAWGDPSLHGEPSASAVPPWAPYPTCVSKEKDLLLSLLKVGCSSPAGDFSSTSPTG